jgi:hypothetical protein
MNGSVRKQTAWRKLRLVTAMVARAESGRKLTMCYMTVSGSVSSANGQCVLLSETMS